MKCVEDCTCFMVGMPSSGKTTYLVSLINMLKLNDQETLLKLKNCDMPKGMKYIQTEIENFNQFKPVGRTIRASIGWMKIPLFDKQGNKVQLRIPDLSGEIFQDLVNERRLKKDIVIQLQAADALLFFLNLDTIAVDLRIPLGDKSAVAILEKGYESHIVESGKVNSIETEPEKNMRVTQVDLVELLQCILYLVKKQIKVKLIVSAWDSVEKRLEPENQLPDKCIEKCLPLLFQFLRTNSERINSEIWGVSAQGFDFTDQLELEKWKTDDIGEHVRVITPTGTETHDLTHLLL